MPSQKEYLDSLSEDGAVYGEREDVDNDLQDIQELLQKSDDNEGIDEEIEALVQGISQEEALAAKRNERQQGQSDFGEKESTLKSADPGNGGQPGEGSGDRQRSGDKKKQQRREKAAAKKAAREEAKQAKKASRAAKADKSAKKSKKTLEAEEDRNVPAMAGSSSRQGESPQDDGEDELLFDISVLDAIVSKAGLMDEKAVRAAARHGNAQRTDAEDILQETDKEPDVPAVAEKDGGNPLKGGVDDDQEGQDPSGIREVDAEDADIPDFPTVDVGEQDNADLEGIDEKEAEDKGLFDQVMDLLSEDETTEDESGAGISAMDEADGEGAEKAPKEKNKKKTKKEKGKKAAKAKKPAKAKKAKPKKQKKQTQKQQTQKQPGKKIPLKKLLPVILLSVSLLVFILVVTHASVDYMDKQTASDAYRRGDYETCYQSLFGKKRNETEEAMYVKSESMLYIRMWIREYEMFAETGDEVRALDSLIQTVNDYPGLYAYAQQYDGGADIYSEYTGVLAVLSDKYGLTEAQAQAIAAEPRDIVYTKMVTAIAQGASFDTWDESWKTEDVKDTETPEEDLPDELPEESDLGGENFISN